MEKICLLATGSFNPITNGHLLMLETVKNAIKNKFDVINGYISPVNQEYGKKGLIRPEDRLLMCHLGVITSDWINVTFWEINQLPKQMKMLREEYNCDPSFKGVPTAAVIKYIRDWTGLPVGFVCGADLFISFEKKEWWTDSEIELIVGDYLFVVERDDSTEKVLKEIITKRPILETLIHKITFIKPTVRNDVSSSAVRKLLKEGKSVKYLVPDSVCDYIKQNNLYL